MGIYGLQQSSQQAEEALSQGLEQLHQSLIDTVANCSINDNMHHMAVALGKLANLEGFVRQVLYFFLFFFFFKKLNFIGSYVALYIKQILKVEVTIKGTMHYDSLMLKCEITML